MDSRYGGFYSRAEWKRKFLLIPRKCRITNKWLWLQTAMEGVAIWTGPGDPAIEYGYHDADEHIIWLIKN